MQSNRILPCSSHIISFISLFRKECHIFLNLKIINLNFSTFTLNDPQTLIAIQMHELTCLRQYFSHNSYNIFKIVSLFKNTPIKDAKPYI